MEQPGGSHRHHRGRSHHSRTPAPGAVAAGPPARAGVLAPEAPLLSPPAPAPAGTPVPGRAGRREPVRRAVSDGSVPADGAMPTDGSARTDRGAPAGGSACEEDGSMSRLAQSLELLDFTEGLSTALTVEEVAQVAFRSIAGLGVTFVGMVLFDDDGDVGGDLGGTEADIPPPDRTGVRTRVLAWPRPPIVDRLWAGPGGYGPAAAVEVMRTGRARFDDTKDTYLGDYPDRTEVFAALGIDATASLPITVDGRTLGVLLLSWPDHRTFEGPCRSFLLAIAAAYGRAVERARRYERQMCMVETLQRAILPPQLPRVDGVQLAARYLPAGRDVGIGGDWYDATVLPDGTLALAIGDVGGHGLRATALMAELSHSARAYALHGLSPEATTTQLSANLARSGSEILATAVIAHLDPVTARFTWSCAGHPPPLHLAGSDGGPRYLSEVHGPMLGVLSDHHYGQSSLTLTGPGLLLYTDGLVEQRGVSISVRLAALAAASAARLPGTTALLAAAPVTPPALAGLTSELVGALELESAPSPPRSTLDGLCDALLAEIAGPAEREDDICILGIALTGRDVR
ncbi:PP2C family protein-serine/threonine phosphatase [Parafrankia elaeagni]|uniref:PP2C family protein-serine/threonine phosphatase n=1 Tax=Parafrankia elaeagni TaxID=222534 RepID=UPI000399E206|nr:GAF domain-containing SpoIIE family protein phosphatase [Parafrankia elaeagni]